jgi:ABC-2 type transport system permease protein
VIRIIARNELMRRVRDRSMLITCIVAPLALAAILGFAFAGGTANGQLTIGVSGVSPTLVSAMSKVVRLPDEVTVTLVPSAATLKKDVNDGTMAGGVVVSARRHSLKDLLIPIVSPGATHTPGFDMLTRPNSLVGQEVAESVAAGIASQLYAARLATTAPHTTSHPTPVSISNDTLGNAGKGVINYFAPSIAVVFLFIGGGMGMRSLLLERSGGTLVRMAAAPVRPTRIVIGKLAAILMTGLVSIGVVWGVTTAVFGADWGAPMGVALMCLGSALAMCGLGVFLTSLAKDEQSAMGIALIVGLFLSLLGGNLLPAGALPVFFQKLSLITPNGWALVGFGRLALLHDQASSVIGPFLVLCLIAAVTGAWALTRVRRMVCP